MLALAVGSTLLWWRALSPLQRWYFWPYLNCAVQGNDPGFYSEVHWLWKTAPRRKQELAADQDVTLAVGKSGENLPVQLSPVARKAGWMGLVRGDEEWIEIRRLQSYLRQNFYADQSLVRMLLTPLLWFMAGVLSMLAAEEVFRDRRSRAPRYWTIQPSRSFPARWADGINGLRSLTRRTINSLSRKKRWRRDQEYTSHVTPEPPAKSASAGLPLFGAAHAVQDDRPVWKTTERDRLM